MVSNQRKCIKILWTHHLVAKREWLAMSSTKFLKKRDLQDFWTSSSTQNVHFLNFVAFCRQLDGCIVWNAHNSTVFGSKCSAICAQAVYYLHSTRPSVTWLNSRWWLAACDWVMSALSPVLSTRIGRRRKFGEVSCTECTGQGNDFELISTVKMKTRNPSRGLFW